MASAGVPIRYRGGMGMMDGIEISQRKTCVVLELERRCSNGGRVEKGEPDGFKG
jgi:hypothetical protein